MTNNQLQQQQNQSVTPASRMRGLVGSESVQRRFTEVLGDNAQTFISSLIDLYNGDDYLAQCNPSLVCMEALKAATLNLKINKELGEAYIVPYKKKNEVIPQLQIGYKGLIQLAQNTGQYKYLHMATIYEGMAIEQDYIRGTVHVTGNPTSNKAIGYTAHYTLLNGQEKTIYKTKEEIETHGRKYSRSFNSGYSPWQTEFNSMAEKTVMKQLLSKYGPLSTEIERVEEQYTDEKLEQEVKETPIEHIELQVEQLEKPDKKQLKSNQETTENKGVLNHEPPKADDKPPF